MRVRSGNLIFDAERRELTRAGSPVHLSPKAFDLLAILLEHSPHAVKKDVIYEQLWPSTFVEYANLNNLISEIRTAIDDRTKTVLVTKARFGYAFAAETTPETDEISEKRDRLFRVACGGKTRDLQPGRNLIGREDDCLIVINSPAVSRYHAAIDVDGSSAILEDLGSKNGTFLGRRRVDAPVELHDRDEIEIGRVLLRFRVFERKATTVSDARTKE